MSNAFSNTPIKNIFSRGIKVKKIFSFGEQVYGYTDEPSIRSITVTPNTDLISNPNTTRQFTAMVEVLNGAGTGVTWSIVSVSGTHGATINQSGLVTISASAQHNAVFRVRATSTFDTSKFGEAQVVINGVVNSITINPVAPTLGLGATQQFTAAVSVTTGVLNTVTWSLLNNNSGATISANGLVTIPDNAAHNSTFIVRATSVFDTTKFAETTVTVMARAAITNLITNGNFASNTIGWTASHTLSRITTSGLPSGETNSGAAQNTGNVNGAVHITRSAALTVVNGRRYYIRALVRNDLSGMANIVQFMNNTTALAGMTTVTIANQTWTLVDFIWTANSNTLSFRINNTGGSGNTTRTMQITNVVIIDLTGDFGAREEPAIADIRERVIAEGGYFDGTRS